MSYILTTLAFIVGGLLPIQVGVNAELARYINSPILAALISFLVGGTCLIFGAVILKTPLPSLNQVASLPTWLSSSVATCLALLSSALSARISRSLRAVCRCSSAISNYG